MNLLTPNTDFHKSYYDKERYLLAWRTSFIFTCMFFILTIISYLLESDGVIPTSITCSIGILSTIYLHITKKFKVIYWIYAITGTLMSNFSMNYVMTSTHYPDIIWIFTSILITFIGLGKKIGFTFILINTIGIISYYIFTLNKLLNIIESKNNLELFGELFELIFAFFVATYLMLKFSEFQNMSEKEINLANKENKFKTNENEVLVKEIHHRVKNNLQIVISLLRLQRNELKSEEAKLKFSEAINRIMVMSLIHQKLYQDKSLAEIKIRDYLIDLTSDITSLSTLCIPIKIEIKSELKKVGLKTIVPLGLIVNELLSNSLEHAFTGKLKAEVYISIKIVDADKIELLYFDNGSWKKHSESHTSFGLELIETLTEQLEGQFDRIISEKGTSYEFILKNIDLESN